MPKIAAVARGVCAPSPHLMRNALTEQAGIGASNSYPYSSANRRACAISMTLLCTWNASQRLAFAGGTEAGAQKKSHVCRILLQCTFDAIMSRSPNFARACGRVSIGRHPDKRPDSRLRLEFQPHYVIGSRRRNRRTPRSTGDAA